MRFLTDWDEATERPMRTVFAVFLLAAAGFTTFAYFTFAQEILVAAIAIGSGVGLLFALYTRSEIRSRRDQREAVPRPRLSIVSNLFDALLVASGLVLAILAVATGDWRLLSAGAVLLTLGLALLLGRRLTRN